MSDYSRGSEWRRLDLHLHTASSYDYKYKAIDADELLCQKLREEKISAVAITDHFIIDESRICNLRNIAPEIVFFPGVELRTDKGTNNLHVILIFPETIDLKILSEDFNSQMIRGKAKAKDSNETIYWDFSDIASFADSHSALVTVHAGRKSNGVDRMISNALPVNMAIKDEIASKVDFFEVGQMRDISDYKTKVFQTIKEKPLIICSDNHDPKNYSTKEYLWIKADPTFEGLRQCVLQPQDRVYVGTIPPTLDRERKNRRNTIKNIEVRKVEDSLNSDIWFDFSLPINSGLVAVIGNKGAGKSALSDILGQTCKCNTMENASFLNEQRFRKLPKNLARDYQATITWCDGHVVQDNLGNAEFNTTIEDAQYLPQEYIEKVCNDLGDDFQKEIDKVIFSYVDPMERGKTSNLNELVANRTTSISSRKENIISQLKTVNSQITRVEEKKTSEYYKKITDGLYKTKEDLERHEKQKPTEVVKPDERDENKEYIIKLQKIEEQISNYEAEIQYCNDEIAKINEAIENGENLYSNIVTLEEDANNIKLQIENYRNIHSITELWPELSLQTPKSSLKEYLDALRNNKKRLLSRLNGTGDEKGLSELLAIETNKKAEHIGTADQEEKNYQKYLEDLSEWNNERKKIIGTPDSEGSVEYFESEKEYLDNRLDEEYKHLIDERYKLLDQLFDLKLQLVSIYDDIYNPIQGEITKLISDPEESVEFKAEIQLRDPKFIENTLKFINQRMSGAFMGRAGANDHLRNIVKETLFCDKSSVKQMIAKISEAVTEDYDAASKKVPDRNAFYDYLYGLDYIDVTFKLKVGGRDLSELSPGERGIVLLIFYLALSKENTPIIVDQPEDNLDNQSVYSKLVPCIKAAKQKRQVIIVTHNPNIAVACDAEQIIYSSMNKKNHRISYQSGSIENNKIKQHVVDVLEGTMPAFDLRWEKYNGILTNLS